MRFVAGIIDPNGVVCDIHHFFKKPKGLQKGEETMSVKEWKDLLLNGKHGYSIRWGENEAQIRKTH